MESPTRKTMPKKAKRSTESEEFEDAYQVEEPSSKEVFNVRNLSDFLKFIDRALTQAEKSSDIFIEVDPVKQSLSLRHEGGIDAAYVDQSKVQLAYHCRLNEKFSALKEMSGKTFITKRSEGLGILESISRHIIVRKDVISAIINSQSYVPPFMMTGTPVRLVGALDNISLAACKSGEEFVENNLHSKDDFVKKSVKMRMDFETLKAKAYEVLILEAGDKNSEFQSVVYLPVSVFVGGPVILLELIVSLKAIDKKNVMVRLDMPDGTDYNEAAFRKINDVLALRPNVVLLEPAAF